MFPAELPSMTDGGFLGSMRIANPEAAGAASETNGPAGLLKSSPGMPFPRAQNFAILFSRMQTLASTGATALRDGQKQLPAESTSANRPGPRNPTPGNATAPIKSQFGPSDDPAPATNRPSGKAQRSSGTAADSEHTRPEMPARAARESNHGKQFSPFDRAEPEPRSPSLQDPSANLSSIGGVSPASLPTPALPAASLETAVPGLDRAGSRFQLSNGLNSTGSVHAEAAGRPVELHTHDAERSASSPTRESSNTLEQESEAGTSSSAQKAIFHSGNPDLATGTVEPHSANQDAHRSQTVEKIHPTPGDSDKGRGAGGASLATSMGTAPGVAPNAIAPHPGSLQDSHRAPGPTNTVQGLDGGDAFKSLDMDAEHPSVRWVHAGAQQAEAGFEDPALGWVSVRANAGSAGVHPALIPSSAEASQVLAGHLAGLNSFLANRAPGVGDVTIASPEAGAPGMGTEAGSGQGSRGQQREGATPDTPSSMALDAGANNRSSSTSGQQEPSLAAATSAAPFEGSGAAYISVMV